MEGACWLEGVWEEARGQKRPSLAWQSMEHPRDGGELHQARAGLLTVPHSLRG